jgi:hypothetical protein
MSAVLGYAYSDTAARALRVLAAAERTIMQAVSAEADVLAG